MNELQLAEIIIIDNKIAKHQLNIQQLNNRKLAIMKGDVSQAKIFTQEERSNIMSISIPLRNNGMSYDDILIVLRRFNLRKIPSKGTIHAWFNE